jgi:excisionase family DNA binding protein
MTSSSYIETQPAAPSLFEPLLDPHEAGALLRMHPKTVVRKAREGGLPAHRVGKYWLFRASELNRWLNEPAQMIGSSCQLDRVHGDSHDSKHS